MLITHLFKISLIFLILICKLNAERSFIALKPDTLQRNLVGECIQRFEKKGLKIIGMKLIQPSREKVLQHYSEHSDKPYFDDMVRFFISGPIVCIVCEGSEAIQICRSLIGKTLPADAVSGTIRGDYCSGKGRNLVHGSDSIESATREIALWFQDEELLAYEKDIDKWVAAPHR
jgi:nucleoside-diphosphate kinase